MFDCCLSHTSQLVMYVLNELCIALQFILKLNVLDV